MKKFFGFGKSKNPSNRDSKTTSQSKLDDIRGEMEGYKGQKYNPAEDDGITTESLFRVVDGDTGEAIDVRELLGVTEEEFRSNPELQAAIAHMNRIQPIEEEESKGAAAAQQIEEIKTGNGRLIQEESKRGEAPQLGNKDQKARHFKYFEMLDTLPVQTDTSQTNMLAESAGQEHVLELNAAGASANVIAWEDWWQLKEEANDQLFQAIGDQNSERVVELLDENPQQAQSIQADVNTKDINYQTPLHSSVFTGNVSIAKLLIERYAEINAEDDQGKTPLHLACQLGNLSLVKLLMVRPECKVSPQDQKGDTPLHIACNNLNEPIIRFLMQDRKTKVHQTNLDQKTPKQVLNQKAKQAGQLTKFMEIIEQMGGNGESQDSSAQATEPQEQNRPNLITIQDADDNADGSQPAPQGKVSLDSFEVIEPLGKGSFGSVYLVSKKGESPVKYYAMKILEKDKVLSQNLVRYARTERNVLSLAAHQFIVGLNFAFQSQSRLYLIMDYAPGGDMGMALANHRRFSVELARIYAAEIVLALEYLHKQNIIFRDLKPDNVVFDQDGHAMLTDFGLSKTGVGSSDVSQSFCGSVAYLAPEMLRRTGHSRSIDWYLLGVLIYEMLVGVPPYFNTSKSKLFENIQQGPLKIPHTMPHDARQIILLLLNRNPQKRLGATNDAEEVKAHEFFASVDWLNIAARQGEVLAPTIRPVKHDTKSIRQFLQQERESRERFADFERTNLRGPQAAQRANVENWSFVRSTDQRP